MEYNQHKSKQNRALYGESIRHTSAKETHENRMPNWAKLNNKGN